MLCFLAIGLTDHKENDLFFTIYLQGYVRPDGHTMASIEAAAYSTLSYCIRYQRKSFVL